MKRSPDIPLYAAALNRQNGRGKFGPSIMVGARKMQIAAIGWFLAAASVSVAHADSIIVRKHAPGITPDRYMDSIATTCQRDWSADAVLAEYCQRKNVSALREISFLLNSFELNSSVKDAVRACMDQWQDGDGYNWHMAQYCFDTRSDPMRR